MTFWKCAALLFALLVNGSSLIHAASPKTIRHAFLSAETNFDPVYLARPAKLKPNTAGTLADVTEGGTLYTFR